MGVFFNRLFIWQLTICWNDIWKNKHVPFASYGFPFLCYGISLLSELRSRVPIKPIFKSISEFDPKSSLLTSFFLCLILICGLRNVRTSIHGIGCPIGRIRAKSKFHRIVHLTVGCIHGFSSDSAIESVRHRFVSFIASASHEENQKWSQFEIRVFRNHQEKKLFSFYFCLCFLQSLFPLLCWFSLLKSNFGQCK